MADVIYKINNKGTDYNIASTAYCTCTTAAAAVEKIANLQDSSGNTFAAGTVPTGVTVHVKFTYSNTASNPTLNVNNSGAKTIITYGTTKAGITANTSWKAGAVVAFTYDGTYWVMNTGIDENTDNNTKNTAGATANTNETLYPIGAPDQIEYSVTYTDENIYISNDNILNVNSYKIGDSNEVWFGETSEGLIGSSNGNLFLSSSSGQIFTNGCLDANGDVYMQDGRLATRSWAIDYINNYMESGGEPEEPEPEDPNADKIIVWVYREHRLNYDYDWENVETIFTPQQFTGIGGNVLSANLRPYSRYSQNNRYCIFVNCATDTPGYSCMGTGAVDLERISISGNNSTYVIKFLQDEEVGLIKSYIVNFSTDTTSVSLQFTITEREYID